MQNEIVKTKSENGRKCHRNSVLCAGGLGRVGARVAFFVSQSVEDGRSTSPGVTSGHGTAACDERIGHLGSGYWMMVGRLPAGAGLRMIVGRRTEGTGRVLLLVGCCSMMLVGELTKEALREGR